MKKELRLALQKYGLLDSEVNVFLTTLDIGEGSASTVAKNVGLNRITTYEILKRLKTKGFIGTRTKPNSSAKIFFPEDLESIKRLIEDRSVQLKTVTKDLDLLSTWYKSMLNFGPSDTRIKFFEGKEGIEKALFKTLDSAPSEILSIVSMYGVSDAFSSEALDKYWKKRTLLKIPTRGIISDSKESREVFNKEKNVQELRRVKFVNKKDMQGFADLIDVTDAQVVLYSLEKGNESAVVIDSLHFAKSWKTLFELLWSRVL